MDIEIDFEIEIDFVIFLNPKALKLWFYNRFSRWFYIFFGIFSLINIIVFFFFSFYHNMPIFLSCVMSSIYVSMHIFKK